MNVFSGYDWRIILPSILLLLISLIILSSIDADLFQNQLLFVLLGIVLFIFFSLLHVRFLQNIHLILYTISLLLLLSIIFFGVDVRGARRWVEIFAFRMQFSEIIKPLLIVSFAAALARWKGKITLLRFVMPVILFLPILLLLLKQPDLGSAMVYALTFLTMFFIGGMSIWYLAGVLFLGVVSFPAIWRALADYQKNRIITFINPQHDPLGIGYNAIQSAIAIGSGLLFGRGLGRGVQSQLQFLPERHTDFIFATFSEEFGFVGSLLLLVLYFLLLSRLFKVAQDSDDRFESCVVFGIFGLLLSQTFINMGMNVGLVPVTGVTLPLLSYGGSSLISTMMLLGIVNAISRGSKKRQQVLEIR